MDATLLLAPREQGFHYSPLKLREYLAIGRAVVAARVGEVERTLTDGKDSLLVRDNDPDALANALRLLYDEPRLRAAISSSAYRLIAHGSSWERQLERVLDRLNLRHDDCALERSSWSSCDEACSRPIG